MEQDFCLKWNNHQQNVITILETLLQRESLVDVTLMADGRMLPAHKFVLSASSPYFENICSQFSDKHTVIVLKDVSYNDMKALLEFMYKGEVKVPADQLGSLVKTAMSLKIKGLGDDNDEEPTTKAPPSPLVPSTQRKTSFENSLDSRKERSRPESPISSKPAKKMRLDNDSSVCEVVPHSPEDLTSPIENIVTEQSVDNAVSSPNETSAERTIRRSTDTPKLEVKAELQEVASSPEIIEEPMDDYDDTRTDTQGGIMQALPGTSGASEEEVYSPWPFTQETSADDSVSLPEGSQGVARCQCERCGRWFNEVQSLEVHRYLCKGPKVKQHKCMYCNYSSNRGYNLKRHYRSHEQGNYMSGSTMYYGSSAVKSEKYKETWHSSGNQTSTFQ